ncbi:MAG TPA: transferrin receptor-like dimerization domain-containing protein, partial [Bryobacteraceae bacterium]|nr:transferrin receptor-like dimerization domain-containing protein [Bryobacteraceae bacterium]
GSTEWAETHADELTRKAVAYINSDNNGRGYLNMSGSHTLEKYMNGVARDIDDPESGVSVWKRLRARDESEQAGGASDEGGDARPRADLRLAALGSGSDYTVFIDHLGVASLNLSYGGEDSGGVYHSIYDDFYWFTHFSDTDFTYGRALAQTAGEAVMRLADADLLPFDYDDFSDTIHRYVDEVHKLAGDARDRAAAVNRRLDDGAYAATEDPRRKTVQPARQDIPPYLNFAPLDNAMAALRRAADAYSQALARVSASGGAAPPAAALREANARLIAVDRALTLPQGLPNRDWFKNQIYAPGFYTGYGVKTLPGVRESIEQNQWDLADREIALAGQTLTNAAQAIESAAAALKQ